MVSKYWQYECDCSTEIQAKTWDPQELPDLVCPDCGDMMDTLTRLEPSEYVGEPEGSVDE